MTRIEFVKFLKNFNEDFERKDESWQNRNISDFLEAMIRYTEDIQGYYDNMSMNVNADEPTWENFSNILKGASMYE